MYSDILEKVRTQKEAQELREEVELLMASLYRVGEEDFNKTLDMKIKAWFADGLRKAFEKGGNKESYLKGLKKELEELEVVKLTLGFEPSIEVIENIHSWVWKNAGKTVVLDLSYNPAILGGAIIAYKGKYEDYSLRSKLRKIFTEEKDTILERLSNTG